MQRPRNAKIRPASAEDYPRIVSLFEEMRGPLPAPSREAWAARLVHSSICLEDGGGLVGYGNFSTEPPLGHVSQIAVEPAARGLGYGRALMRAMAAEMSAAGCTSWDLHVERGNLPAKRLYQSLGLVAGHRSCWVEIEWSVLETLSEAEDREDLEKPAEVDRSEDALLEERFNLQPGRLAGCRSRPGTLLFQLHATGSHEAVGLAAFNEPARLVSPLRVQGQREALALLLAVPPPSRAASIRVVIDGDDALVEFFREIGGRIVFDTIHMEGRLEAVTDVALVREGR